MGVSGWDGWLRTGKALLFVFCLGEAAAGLGTVPGRVAAPQPQVRTAPPEYAVAAQERWRDAPAETDAELGARVRDLRQSWAAVQERVARAGLGPEVADAIWDLCSAQGVPVGLVLRLVEVESRWDPNLEHWNDNGTVDRGLMQINSGSLAWLARTAGLDPAVADPLDPEQNLRMGVSHLGYLFRKYGDWHQALTAYNRGEAGLRHLIQVSRSGESTYSRRVLQGVPDPRQAGEPPRMQ